MKRPFNIFPRVGYRNSQFQIVSILDNVNIKIYTEDKLVKSIKASSQYPTIISKLDKPGMYIAKCLCLNEVYEQQFEIKEAYRLGSSKFKKAFVFDNTDYSFFLMKDRLLLYDEKNKLLLTENHYSPSTIYKINKVNFLFVTKIGSSTLGIVNLGIYNIETFSITGELLNDYKEIKILPKSNKVWLLNKSLNTIHCYEIVNSIKPCFSELKKYSGFINYTFDNSKQLIYVDYDEKLIIADMINLHSVVEIPKTSNNAIDKQGNILIVSGNSLICTNFHENLNIKVTLTFHLNLNTDNFIHIGKELKYLKELSDLDKNIDELKDDIIATIPHDEIFYIHLLSDDHKISESYTIHDVFPTNDGVFILHKDEKRWFNGIIFKKHKTKWIATPDTIKKDEFCLVFYQENNSKTLINKSRRLTVSSYCYPILLVSSRTKKYLVSGIDKLEITDECSIDLFSVEKTSYFIIESNKRYSLYSSTNLNTPILKNKQILNANYIVKQKIIWYYGKSQYSNLNFLYAYDLKSCSPILIDKDKIEYSIFKESGEFAFYKSYALSPNHIVFNPTTLEIMDAFIGKMESYSEDLGKIVSHRSNAIYLSTYDSKLRKYHLSEIMIDEERYKESYLSPNGQFLVLQEENNQYVWYDIKRNEKIKFISGNFLSFRKDGSLIIEEDWTKAVKIIDPLSFQDISPPNYHHYRFTSPDGRLYAQVSSKFRYLNKLTGIEITKEEFLEFRRNLDQPSHLLKEGHKIDRNRQQLFLSYRQVFFKLGIHNYNEITSNTIIRIEKYVEIGICETQVIKEVILPDDTSYYNYAAFSFDNKYLGIVGKPTINSQNKSLIMLCSLSVDFKKNLIKIEDTFISRFPSRACWVCGFSQSGYFATYDSIPDTFLINIDQGLTQETISDIELRQNIDNLKINIYNSYKEWNVIKGKNFLCFSPSGEFLALSEQGYEPLTLGGYGHQESNVVHIAKTINGEVIESFIDHGDKIANDIDKKVTFVSFSEDEKRLMTLSSDGVIIIRDIDIKLDEQKDVNPAKNQLMY